MIKIFAKTKIFFFSFIFLLGTQSLFLSQTATFNYTGSVQTWTVPPCVFCLNIDMRGAQGGGILGNPYGGSGQGGRGAGHQHPFGVTGHVMVGHIGVVLGHQHCAIGADKDTGKWMVARRARFAGFVDGAAQQGFVI